MYGRQPLDDDEIASALVASWRIECRDLVYEPVGFGSWHWAATSSPGDRLFVTLDDVGDDGHLQTFDDLCAALAVPLALARAGHAFARAPVPTTAGDVAVAIGQRWALSVWPFVEGNVRGHGGYGLDDRRAVLQILRVLHARGRRDATATGTPRETFEVRGRSFLERALDGGLDGWDRGPYAGRARELLDRSAGSALELLARYDEHVGHAPRPDAWVLTHGEPHAGNVVFTDDGPVLIDWDTARIAPRERDLRTVLTPEVTESGVDQRMVQLYDMQWALEEISGYLHLFHNPHGESPDTATSWRDLNQYLPVKRHFGPS